jgi:hypothetical protein
VSYAILQRVAKADEQDCGKNIELCSEQRKRSAVSRRNASEKRRDDQEVARNRDRDRRIEAGDQDQTMGQSELHG